MKRCLLEVIKHDAGPFSPRDLYPYQLALAQIDAFRKDGNFLSRDGSIPEGQGIVNSGLSECHELLTMLKEGINDDDSDEDDDN